MLRFLSFLLALACAILVWFWISGGFDQLGAYAASEQRAFQNQIARALRSVRGGDTGALWALLTVCFAYGFFHAIGPGHGKVLIGGDGMGRRVPWMRLSVISLLASLGQAVTAVVLVQGGIWVFSMTRDPMIGMAENIMAPASYAAIALVGLWLIWRGTRLIRRKPQASHVDQHGHDHHGHDHHHGHDDGPECDHRHGPTPDEIGQVSSVREALILIAGIAIRPCTGAIFVLIITWQMGIALAGIAGAFAMALGTATITIAVGIAAVTLRGGFITTLSDSRLATQIIPMIEILAGVCVTALAGGLLAWVLI